MSEQPQMPKLRLAPKPEEPKPEPPKPQVAVPPVAPPVAPPVSPAPGGQPQAEAVPPALGTPPSPVPTIETTGVAGMVAPDASAGTAPKSSSGGIMSKIVPGLIGLLIGAVLGAGGIFTMQSSKHAAEIQALEKEVADAKKETAEKIAAEQGKITEALADAEKKAADAVLVRESELRREAEEKIAKKRRGDQSNQSFHS
ncbi:hypothetical protein QQ056_05425 [Oscillatoria laete-virens NRMC-F 0139]|nr:hypothetical protein [Oscillatoria laete-virens]MDL5052994.1 hypothetical protein [Oscillatoria laete-virens NRMC-F 0139]